MINLVTREEFQDKIAAASTALSDLSEYLEGLIPETEEVNAEITSEEVNYLQGSVDAASAIVSGLSSNFIAADLAVLHHMLGLDSETEEEEG